MKLYELRKAVRDRNGIPESGDGLAEHAVVNDCVRAALTDISAEYRWPWLLTSTALTFSTTTGKATLPATVAVIHKLVIGAPPRPASRGSLDEYVTQARSYIFAELGTEIGLYPVPATVPAATLWYYRNEPALANDNAEPLLPDTFHQTLIARASYHLNTRRPEAKRAAADLDEYRAGIKNMMQVTERGRGASIQSAFRTRNPASW